MVSDVGYIFCTLGLYLGPHDNFVLHYTVNEIYSWSFEQHYQMVDTLYSGPYSKLVDAPNTAIEMCVRMRNGQRQNACAVQCFMKIYTVVEVPKWQAKLRNWDRQGVINVQTSYQWHRQNKNTAQNWEIKHKIKNTWHRMNIQGGKLMLHKVQLINTVYIKSPETGVGVQVWTWQCEIMDDVKKGM